jgi:hypothetical protein
MTIGDLREKYEYRPTTLAIKILRNASGCLGVTTKFLNKVGQIKRPIKYDTITQVCC